MLELGTRGSFSFPGFLRQTKERFIAGGTSIWTVSTGTVSFENRTPQNQGSFIVLILHGADFEEPTTVGIRYTPKTWTTYTTGFHQEKEWGEETNAAIGNRSQSKQLQFQSRTESNTPMDVSPCVMKHTWIVAMDTTGFLGEKLCPLPLKQLILMSHKTWSPGGKFVVYCLLCPVAAWRAVDEIGPKWSQWITKHKL